MSLYVDKSKLPIRIKIYCAKKGIKLKDINERFGISYHYLQRIARCALIPSDSLALRISYALDQMEKEIES